MPNLSEMRMAGVSLLKILFLSVVVCLLEAADLSAAADWVLIRSETFDVPQQLADQVPFGDRGWLVPRLRGNGQISVQDGLAHVESPDFRDSALIGLAQSLPPEYKIRARLGRVKYSLDNYEPDDYAAPDFKYSEGWSENGFYWITLTDRAVEENSGEDWWHRYRKIVIDSDDHTGVPLPLYMVYMNPELDRTAGNWTNGMPELLRTWSNSLWHIGTWNWEVAFHYNEASWYTVELEKTRTHLIMRVFDEHMALIEETAPVALNLVYGMGEQASELEYAYIGEPHVDSYEGDAYIDSVELYVPRTSTQAVDASDGLHSNRVTVGWVGVEGADGYYIYRAGDLGADFVQVGATAANITSFDDPIACGTGPLFYRIKALFSTTLSDYSPADRGFTDACGGSQPATIHIDSCGTLGQANTTYILDNDVVSEGTCFIITANGITLDLNGKSVTYDAYTAGIPNADFELGSGETPSDWDLSQAPGVIRRSNADLPLVGEWHLYLGAAPNDTRIVSSYGDLPPDSTAVLHFLRGDLLWPYNGDAPTWEVKVEADDGTEVLRTTTQTSWSFTFTTLPPASPSRKYRAILTLLDNKDYAPSQTAYFRYPSIDWLDIRTTKNHGISVKYREKITLKNGRLIQGLGKSFRGHAINLEAVNHVVISDLEFDTSGLESSSLFSNYGSDVAFLGNSVLNRSPYKADRQQVSASVFIGGA